MKQQEVPSLFTSLDYALKTYAHHFILLLSVSFIYSLGGLVYSYLLKQVTMLFSIPLLLITWIGCSLFFLFLILGIIRITLDLYFKKESSLLRLVSCTHLFPTFFVASLIFGSLFTLVIWVVSALVYGIATFFAIKIDFNTQWNVFATLATIATLLLSRLLFFPYFIVDLKVTALQSIQLSMRKTKKYLSTILVLIIFFAGIDYALYKILPLLLNPTLYYYINLLVEILIRPVIFLSFVYLYGHMERPQAIKII